MRYIDEVSSAIEFIEANLEKKLDLDMVSTAVHYSKYHLHRVFSSTVGMTMHEYIQRRQLTEAAKLLVFSSRPIIDIALLSGYESQQAFTNVFTAMYKLSPSKYRESEKFYPLQLKFNLEGSYDMLNGKDEILWEIRFANEEDIPCWMELVRLVIDGFPHLYEEEYIAVLKQKMNTKQALILKDGQTAVGILLFSYDQGSIDFMGCHPLYRKMGIPRAFLNKVMRELLKGKDITITTYREGDKADTGQRREIKGLGFAEEELLTEYGYPTQRFILRQEECDDERRSEYPG
ncbi:AraC family transcriptional regulator [Clostridium sp. AM58-1XD]|uniref:helix-turn-helix domain-containing protein n=1 Tax=Clostridium sp. AM58-1XD TaxID=2292307 RepID=UPI000E497EC5|nr:AraC family transcriptional regulator [Clostridium sp. AM58-1XD]RGZ00428.1 AraC family transcriptional regulator [Clostridium sp. AM58-1XD]